MIKASACPAWLDTCILSSPKSPGQPMNTEYANAAQPDLSTSTDRYHRSVYVSVKAR
ncbi:hypothetical protein BDV18DRAFT_129431 [Aspergillus unguis]